VVASFKNKGLEEIYFTGKTRRIGAEFVRKCVRILQSLEVATRPEDMNGTELPVPSFARQSAEMVR
jgi:plasmid maintenance system killer protein